MKWMEWLDNHLHNDTSLPEQISVCDCIHMTASHGRSCWNSLHVYEVDLIWVWSVWGVLIINYSMAKRWITYCHHCAVRPSIHQVGVASLWPLATVAGAETLYIYIWRRSNMSSMKWVRCSYHITYSTLQVRNRENLLLLPVDVRPIIHQVRVASLWPLAALEGAETLYVCMIKTSYEYELEMVLQS
jgi:hypothetical protein